MWRGLVSRPSRVPVCAVLAVSRRPHPRRRLRRPHRCHLPPLPAMRTSAAGDFSLHDRVGSRLQHTARPPPVCPPPVCPPVMPYAACPLLSRRDPLLTSRYDVLGVTRDASQAEIRRVFRALSVKYHPDKNDDSAAAQRFTVAVLSPSCVFAWSSYPSLHYSLYSVSLSVYMMCSPNSRVQVGAHA
jgi:hypothetical protein